MVVIENSDGGQISVKGSASKVTLVCDVVEESTVVCIAVAKQRKYVFAQACRLESKKNGKMWQ